MNLTRKVSTTTYPIVFMMVDSTDHVTGETGLTPTVTLSKNGGGYAAAAGSVTELGGGLYALAGNATDRDTLGELWVHADGGAGVDKADFKVDIVSHDPYGDISEILTDTGTTIPGLLDAIKGAGWADETLVALMTAVESGTVDEATIRSAIGLSTANLDTQLAAIDSEVGTIYGDMASVSDVWSNTTRTLTDPDSYKADVSGLATAAALTTVDNEVGVIDGIVDAIKAKTDNLPANTATALAAIQSDLDNPNQYKADVSGLATQASVNAIPTTPLLAANYTAPDNASIAAILEDTGTTIPATLAGLATSTEVGAIALLGETVIGSYTVQDILKILAAKMVGKATGGGTATITYRGVDDTTDVVVETVDTNGNRSAVTLTV